LLRRRSNRWSGSLDSYYSGYGCGHCLNQRSPIYLRHARKPLLLFVLPQSLKLLAKNNNNYIGEIGGKNIPRGPIPTIVFLFYGGGFGFDQADFLESK
jgi:hypothetical protein